MSLIRQVRWHLFSHEHGALHPFSIVFFKTCSRVNYAKCLDIINSLRGHFTFCVSVPHSPTPSRLLDSVGDFKFKDYKCGLVAGSWGDCIRMAVCFCKHMQLAVISVAFAYLNKGKVVLCEFRICLTSLKTQRNPTRSLYCTVSFIYQVRWVVSNKWLT